MKCIFDKPFNSHIGRFTDRTEVEVPDSLFDVLPTGTEIIEPPKMAQPKKVTTTVKKSKDK
tara:strand:- start:1954 stop:2136 length:183 start_codon:yes stop_codon:yes gene_type:complete